MSLTSSFESNKSSLPSGKHSVTTHKRKDEFRSRAHSICKDYLHGAWTLIPEEDMIIRQITGGLSNLLYCCELPSYQSPLGEEPKKVLLRMYGQVRDGAHEATITDSVIFTLLAERKLGPKLYGIFPGGRLEEFIQAFPLTCREMSTPRISAMVAQRMAQVHNLKVPISKEPVFLWQTMKTWVQLWKRSLAESSQVQSELASAANQRRAIVDHLAAFNFEHEVEWLRQFVCQTDSPVIFCHNDCQEGNILKHANPASARAIATTPSTITTTTIPTSTPTPNPISATSANAASTNNSVASATSTATATTATATANGCHDSSQLQLTLIDFEYCSYNYRGFDLANHFCEWMYDYTRPEYPHFCVDSTRWPSQQQQLHFIRAYLKARDSENETTTTTNNNNNCTTTNNNNCNNCTTNNNNNCSNNNNNCNNNNNNCNNKDNGDNNNNNPSISTAVMDQKLNGVTTAAAAAAGGGGDAVVEVAPAAAPAVAEQQLEERQLLAEVRVHELSSHLFWTLWSVANAPVSDIAFGYWEYAHCRLQAYQSRKEQLLRENKIASRSP